MQRIHNSQLAVVYIPCYNKLLQDKRCNGDYYFKAVYGEGALGLPIYIRHAAAGVNKELGLYLQLRS